MKNLSQNLKQAFDALEFTNANHLNALNTKLNSDRNTAAARTERQPEQHNHTFEHITGAAAS